MTNVLAVSGSLRREKGTTSRILLPFLEGMRGAGASVELRYVKDIRIEPCRGDFHCWDVEPGVCIIKDGMEEIYRKLRSADILVLATPVYIPLPGEMQNFINRLCPLVDPLLSFKDGRTRARLRKGFSIRKIVLVSSGGWWEKGNFDTVKRICEEIAKDVSVEFAGALLRPHAYLMYQFEEKAMEITKASKEAGRQLVAEGRIPAELLDAVSQPLVPEEVLRERYNRAYRVTEARAGKAE